MRHLATIPQTPQEIAERFAALRPGRRAEYVGGGWLLVRNVNQTGTPCPYRIKTTEAAAQIARAYARVELPA